MSENTQVSAAQNPAENPSNAAYSDPSWQSDFDTLNGIQYILFLTRSANASGFSPDTIYADIQNISDRCQAIGDLLSGPFAALNPSDAVKLIASVANSLPDQQGSNIISACKEIDPSLAS